ncbi:hypothetical protein [Bacillus sp. PS06]|uniref:YfjL-like protein n=1 Tax=Bacillus sp. PS06 TaxID=2764176 RepID=UPI0017820B78|nr:hypothetical protein [Bacillus sp. PS06]MBD8068768.1 hypothetical protein [Bacillus sp. PS06]
MKKKRRPLKILAGTIAILLIAGLLFITNAFVGNPVSAALANKAIKQYVEMNYSHLDLDIPKSSYNFKDGTYSSRVKSKSSMDTKFSIYYRSGKVQWDDYDGYVLNKFNTLERLSSEYSVIAKNIIATELGFENNRTMVIYDHEDNLNVLELDMKFDKALPIASEVVLRLDLKEPSLEMVEKILIDAHQAFLTNDCHFNQYSLYTDDDELSVMVNGVTPSHIESGELLTLLEKARNSDDFVDGISVFIK